MVIQLQEKPPRSRKNALLQLYFTLTASVAAVILSVFVIAPALVSAKSNVAVMFGFIFLFCTPITTFLAGKYAGKLARKLTGDK